MVISPVLKYDKDIGGQANAELPVIKDEASVLYQKLQVPQEHPCPPAYALHFNQL